MGITVCVAAGAAEPGDACHEHHGRQACALVEGYFDAEKVMRRVLETGPAVSVAVEAVAACRELPRVDGPASEV